MRLFSVELEKENQTSKERFSTQLAQVFRIALVLVDTTDADTGATQSQDGSCKKPRSNLPRNHSTNMLPPHGRTESSKA